MNYIENISAKDCKEGNHMDPGDNTMLIQIADTCVGCQRLNMNSKNIISSDLWM